MAFCTQCGSESAGNFCGSCGAAIGARASGSAPGPPPPPLAQPGLNPNVASALCYFAGIISGVLFLVLEPYNHDKTVRFHAFQSIFASLALFGTAFVLAILANVWFIGLLIAFILGFVLPLGTLALWIILMYKAYNGEHFVLPIVGPLAEKQA